MLKKFKNSLRRAKERFKSRIEGRTTTKFSIKHDNTGMTVTWLTIENNSGSVDIVWNDVEYICAFKIDLFAYDLICLKLNLKDEIVFEIDERMDNFNNLIDSLPVYLPGCLETNQWFDKVAIPAFETNLTLIYKLDSVILPKELQNNLEFS